MLAQLTHAPRLVVRFEAGGVAPRLPTMPISVGDSRTFHRGLMATRAPRLALRDGRLGEASNVKMPDNVKRIVNKPDRRPRPRRFRSRRPPQPSWRR